MLNKGACCSRKLKSLPRLHIPASTADNLSSAVDSYQILPNYQRGGAVGAAVGSWQIHGDRTGLHRRAFGGNEIRWGVRDVGGPVACHQPVVVIHVGETQVMALLMGKGPRRGGLDHDGPRLPCRMRCAA